MPHKPLKYIDPKGKTKNDLIKEQTPIHSKSANKNFYKNYDRIFKKEKDLLTVDESGEISEESWWKLVLRDGYFVP